MANPHIHPTNEISSAASTWLESLNPDQLDKATFEYLDGERVFWYYPPLNRHGLAIRDMNEIQRHLAFSIMETCLDKHAFAQAKQIIELESILGKIEASHGIKSFARDPELYYFTVFGNPKSNDPWGWRVEGHHVSLHFSIWNDKVISTTPFFFGSNPAEVKEGPHKGLRVLSDREDLGFELIQSLDSSQQKQSIIFEEAPYDILLYNSTKAFFPKEEGLIGSKMSGVQKELFMSLIIEYVNDVRPEIAKDKLSMVNELGIDNFHFAWGGGTSKGHKHYYRIHCGDFIVEYDNRQGDGNHIHSVLRDTENDFANDVLRDHLMNFHVL